MNKLRIDSTSGRSTVTTPSAARDLPPTVIQLWVDGILVP
jgi:hypothetical protein